MKNYLIILLLLAVASKKLEYAIETAYDKDNDEFEFTSSGNSYIFGYITCSTSNNLDMEVYLTSQSSSFSDSRSISINKPGQGFIFDSKTENGNIVITYIRPDSGVIWINPEDKVINVDLNKKYEFKVAIADSHLDGINTPPKLKYVINNAAKDVTFQFYYDNEVNIPGDELDVSNPFEVCHQNDCQSNVDTYDFVKGESYEIYVKMERIAHGEIDTYWVLTSFYFADKNYKESSSINNSNDSFYFRLNIWIISLFLILL